MAFVFSRPPTPPQRDDEPFSSPNPSNVDLDMHTSTTKDKERSRLEILLDKECIYLKGTGIDVEPARLSGHVALYLSESTSVKEITLQFRGKARLPVPAHDSLSLNPSPITYVVCHHEWSFLEGEKKHSHTLKAGRHLFPFQLQLGGSLPSTIWTNVYGGASVAYKLRAHAVRPGLTSHNLQSLIPVTIIRSFAPEALEYQQTLEIENTWPEKLMYSIMIPHKAWAAGDTLTALTKFSPLVKGVGVLNINTTIHETTKIYARSGYQEYTRVVASAKHEIVGGKAVEAPEHSYKTPGTPMVHSAPHTPAVAATSRMATAGSYFASTPMLPSSSGPEAGPSTVVPSPSSSSSLSISTYTNDTDDEREDLHQTDVVTHLSLPIPLTITPTHGLDPIVVSHRIRWSILILNLDGHTSELRCSLPLHLLDYRVLDEARSFTSATRRLLLGGPEVPPEQDEDMELPSYTAHVRDRVANMFLPESATMRVTNPWVQGGVSPTVVRVGHEAMSPWPRSNSGTSSPLEAHLLSHLPHAPGSGDSTPLDWVNSELLLSLSQDQPPPLSIASRATLEQSPEGSPSDFDPTSRQDSRDGSRPTSRPTSTRPSRLSSRASSPERATMAANLHVAGPNETYVHNGSNASRTLGGLFKASMKPFTSITHPAWLSSRSNSHSQIPTLAMTSAASQQQQLREQREREQAAAAAMFGPRLQFADPNSGTALLHRAFTEVPDYRMASRGFIGGVPPLSSMTGLPSYEEASHEADSALFTPQTLPHSCAAGEPPRASFTV